MREGYYSVVNGYKMPFIDEKATKAAKEDRFKDGTSFSDLYALFCFDRDLREATFKHLVQVEAIVRTVCSYTFADNHREKSAYLVQANYCTEDDFTEFGLKNYMDNLLKLQTLLYKNSSRSSNPSIDHYRRQHGEVPIWVLSKTMTFGNIEHFFHLMKPAERREVCKRIAEATGHIGDGHTYFDPKVARKSLDPIVKFRNICAHDERLYCAKVGRRDPVVDYASMLDLVEPFLREEDYREFLSDATLITVIYHAKNDLSQHVLRESGLDRILEKAVDATDERLDLMKGDPTATRYISLLRKKRETGGG